MGVLKKIIHLVVHLCGKIYTYKLNKKLVLYFHFIYSEWISLSMGKVGDATYFSPPIILQGGGQRRIKIGSNTNIAHHVILGCWEHYGTDSFEPEIIIGDYCSIGEYCQITAINKITIGDGLLTGRFVFIGDNAHGGLSSVETNIPPAKRRLTSKGEIKIGRNVWIGDKVSILSGVTIGDNVIIGAGSIVTHDIPSNSMAAGIPAKIIKQILN